MRSISNAFQRYLYENNRNYVNRVEITLSDGTPLTIDNTRLWTGGVNIDDNVSDQSSFTALGSAIINSLQIIINNIYDEYSAYIFEGAKVIPYTGLLIGTSVEEIKLGEYTVDSASYNGSLITLNCLDNMAKFDKPYSSSSLVYPATLQQIVSDACTNCGVLLESTTFSNYTFSVATRPVDEALTYREVIAYAATLAGCFAKCNSKGKLELNWFDVSAIQEFSNNIEGGIFDADTPYSTGDAIDGGNFNPWNTGDVVDGGTFSNFPNLHFLTALSSQDIGVDDIVITGIQIQIKIEGGTSTDIETPIFGNEGYLIKIENNPFITVDNVQAVGTYLQNKIVGLTFRNATLSHLNDPSIEAGDVAIVRDRKNNLYPILITNTEFTVDSYQRTISAAEPPLRHEAVRFNQVTKSFVESKEMVKKEATLREQLQESLTQAINAKSGMYETRVQETGGGYTYYMHDKPNLNESTAVIKITNEGVGITPNYQATPITWYGLTVDGTFIANIMSVIGIDFDWGTGGTLTLGGQNNVNGTLTMKNAQNQTIGYWNNTGINASAGSIGPWTIGATGIYNGKSSASSTANGTYIGTDEISGRTSDGRYALIPGGRLILERAYGSSLGESIELVDWESQSLFHFANIDTGNITLYDGAILITAWDIPGSVGANYDPHIEIGMSGSEPSVYVGQENGHSGIRVNGEGVNDVGIELYGGNKGARILFQSLKDGALLSNVYNNTVYNLIRNHGNGNISVSASNGGLYLGYENTTLVNILNGAFVLAPNYLELTNTTANAYIRVRNSTTGNGIYLYADKSNGTVSIGSNSANGTGYTILSRADNSGWITAQNNWAFPNSPTIYSNIIMRNSGLTKGTNPSAEASRLIVWTDKDGYSSTQADVLTTFYGGGLTPGGTSYSILRQYKNTTASLDYIQLLLNYPSSGAACVQVNGGYFETLNDVISTVSSGEAHCTARNSATGNRIFLYANSSNGQAGLYSFSADNTARAILVRDNNSNAITAYGTWTFSNVASWNNTGKPIVSEGSDNYRISKISTDKSGTTYYLKVIGQFNSTTYSLFSFTQSSSDIRLKDNVSDCNISALPIINAIRMRQFDWKQDKNHQDIGMVADELEQIDEKLVVGGGYEKDGSMNVKSVDTFYLVGYLVKAVQELSAEVERLKGEIK